MGDTVIYLFTSASGDKLVKSNQDALEQLFYIRGLIYEPVDAVDPANKELRTDLFSVSGLRAQYPQVFLKSRDGSYKFIGQYEEIQRLNERDELTCDWQDMFAKVNMFYDDEMLDGSSNTNSYFVEGVVEEDEEEELKEAAEKTPIRSRIIPQDLEGEALMSASNNYLQKMQLLSSSKKKKHEYQMFPRESEQQIESQSQINDKGEQLQSFNERDIGSALKTIENMTVTSTVNENAVDKSTSNVENPLHTPIKSPFLPPPSLPLQTSLPPPPMFLPPPPTMYPPPSISEVSSSTPAPKVSTTTNATTSIETTSSTPLLSPRSKARRRAAGDWEECTTMNGEVYYFKRTTGESSWVDPRGAILESVLDAGNAISDPIWLPMTDSKGRTYYYNRTTGKSSWKKI